MKKISSRPLEIKDFVLNYSALIEASAGTGKTFTITYLVLRLLLGSGTVATRLAQGPLDLDQILIVTFTRAATSDLKKRIRENIRQAREAFLAYEEDNSYRSQDEPLNQLLAEMVSREISLKECVRILTRAERNIDEAAICTIHSFCNRALNQIYSFEAGEAFATELSEDISLEQKEALTSVWRELFYTKEDRSFLLNLFGKIDPLELAPKLAELQKVELTDPKAGVLGFAVKGRDFLDKSKTLQENFLTAKNKLQKLLSKEQECIHKFLDTTESTFNYYVNTQEFCLRKENIKTSKALSLSAGSKDLLKAIAAAYDRSDNAISILIECVSKYSRNFLIQEKQHNAVMADSAYLAFEEQVISFCKELGTFLSPKQELKQDLLLIISILASQRLKEKCLEDRVMSNDDVLKRLDYALNCRGEHSERLAALLRHRYPVAMIDEFQDTDPTQFSIFKRIYLDKEAQGTARCYLIGDPKQSIYAFRGADINSYIDARDLVIEQSNGEGLYTLDKNYRSHPKLVAAVNAMFLPQINEQNTNPFLTDDISFNAVKSNTAKSFFSFDGKLSSDVDEALIKSSFIEHILTETPFSTAAEFRACYAKCCALKVKQCLETGYLYKKTEDGLEKQKVKPSDIAILVRSKEENALIQQELDALQIGSVYYSDQTSVLGGKDELSVEAQNIIYLMEALCDFSNPRKVRRLIGSDLLSYSGDEFYDHIDEEIFEREVKLLFDCQFIWQRDGFLGAFLKWYKDPLHDGLSRTLSLEKGERRVTNYLHLAEIVQQSHGKVVGIRAQLRWFYDLCTQKLNTLTRDDSLKRLDSEYDQIKILTIFKSKGLEFPIVMLPFLWGEQKEKTIKNSFDAITYYDRKDKRLSIDLVSSPLNIKSIQEDREQEERRLLYVALTRACVANFFFVTDIQCKGASMLSTTMRSMLSSDGTTDDLIKALETPLNADLFTIESVQKSELTQINPYLKPKKAPEERLYEFSSLKEGDVDRSFSFSSYSALVAGLHDRFSPIDEEGDDDTSETELPSYSSLNAFSFPRGAEPGTVLHSLLENCDFYKVNNQDYVKDYVANFIKQSVNLSTLKAWSARQDQVQEALEAWLLDIVHSPLIRLGEKTFSLSELKNGDYVPEMNYMLPAIETNSLELNTLCKESAYELIEKEKLLNKQDIENLFLDKRTVTGFIEGFLDLVMRVKHKDGYKYYVIDYKSTHLGNSYADYSKAELAQSIFDNRNRYDLQYLLYTLALHRMLKLRKPDYDYDKDIGGVLYLYLRGLKRPGIDIASETSSGVFFTKPSLKLIEKLDAAFDKK